MFHSYPMRQTRIAIAQTPITADPVENGTVIRTQMRAARGLGARLVQFPECAASGYVKSEIRNWSDVDWTLLRSELEKTSALAAELGLWVVVGSAHPLAPGTRPHNSLYVIDDHGVLSDRYDKRFLSNTEITDWFTPGFRPVEFEIDGIRFGCALCIEINFPELFRHYEESGVDAVLLSSYSNNVADVVRSRAHADLNKLWVALSIPADPDYHALTSLAAGPDGGVIARAGPGSPCLIVADIDPDDSKWDIDLRRARPWRAAARQGGIYEARRSLDPRSKNRWAF